MSEAKWYPSAEVIAAANLTAAMAERGAATYDEFYEWSARDRAGFWSFTMDRLGIRMSSAPSAMILLESPPENPVWLPDGELNIAESCFARDAGADAVRYRTNGAIRSMTYRELRQLANRVANGLSEIGVAPGDRVAIAMSMSVESVAAYLGIVLAGAVVVSIADSFAPDEIATRIRITGARLAITQDVLSRSGKTLPMYEKVIAAGIERAVVIETGGALGLRAGDLAWSSFLSPDDVFDPVRRKAGDHSNILFSSGTTGDPKAIPWTHVAPVKAAADGHYHHDIHPTDTVAWPTNLGWMMGPWLIYATLVNGATIALFDDVPTGVEFAEFVEEAGVTVLGLVPSLVASWRKSHAPENADWSRIRLFSSTGEASNADDMAYLMDLAGNKPIIDYIGGTELAGGYMAATVLQPCIPATFTTPTLGGAIHILDESGNPADTGELFIEPPVVGLSVELLNRDHHEVYYAGTPDNAAVLRRHGDEIERLPNGHYRALGRVDDTMNLGGIKVSSAEIERTVTGTPGLIEAAAVAVEPPGGGPSRLVLFAVVEPEAGLAELGAAMQQRIRSRLNPLFKISDVVPVDALPRTASAKVIRGALRRRYANQ